ncbi:hypothetical protein HMI56_004927, partial [Coelomomyces lativittatus]
MENANKNLLKSLTFLYNDHESLYDLFQSFLETDSKTIQQDFNILKNKYKNIFKKIPKPGHADSTLKQMFRISLDEGGDWPRLKITFRDIEASLPLTTHLALWNVPEMSISARMVDIFQSLQNLLLSIREWEEALLMVKYNVLRTTEIYVKESEVRFTNTHSTVQWTKLKRFPSRPHKPEEEFELEELLVKPNQ